MSSPSRRLARGGRRRRALLWLYPARFRREHGQELLLLVHDLSRDARRRDRTGQLAFWAALLADLAVTALREHATEVSRMTRSTFVRWSGLAAAVGGSVFMTSMVTPLRGPLRAGVPGSVACMAAGAAGLYALLHGRQPRLERLGLALAGTGLSLGMVGMAGSALGVVDPNPWAPVINTGEHLGLVFIGAGMVTWGVLAVRTSALGRWSFAPIPIGLCGLAGLTLLDPAAFHALENGPLPLVFSGAWILLGLALLQSGRRTDPAPLAPA